ESDATSGARAGGSRAGDRARRRGGRRARPSRDAARLASRRRRGRDNGRCVGRRSAGPARAPPPGARRGRRRRAGRGTARRTRCRGPRRDPLGLVRPVRRLGVPHPDGHQVRRHAGAGRLRLPRSPGLLPPGDRLGPGPAGRSHGDPGLDGGQARSARRGRSRAGAGLRTLVTGRRSAEGRARGGRHGAVERASPEAGRVAGHGLPGAVVAARRARRTRSGEGTATGLDPRRGAGAARPRPHLLPPAPRRGDGARSRRRPGGPPAWSPATTAAAPGVRHRRRRVARVRALLGRRCPGPSQAAERRPADALLPSPRQRAAGAGAVGGGRGRVDRRARRPRSGGVELAAPSYDGSAHGRPRPGARRLPRHDGAGGRPRAPRRRTADLQDGRPGRAVADRVRPPGRCPPAGPPPDDDRSDGRSRDDHRRGGGRGRICPPRRAGLGHGASRAGRADDALPRRLLPLGRTGSGRAGRGAVRRPRRPAGRRPARGMGPVATGHAALRDRAGHLPGRPARDHAGARVHLRQEHLLPPERSVLRPARAAQGRRGLPGRPLRCHAPEGERLRPGGRARAGALGGRPGSASHRRRLPGPDAARGGVLPAGPVRRALVRPHGCRPLDRRGGAL
ncbi:MAG: hypothetical protein AVDCRST_MAG32-1843, partial [uncultured Nocardioides sp.]